MRCPKCQYLGFEPSPRCKHCGYDFSFGNEDLPSLTIVPEPHQRDALADFDLQVLDGAAARPKITAMSGGFDLDDLLARGRSEPALEKKFRPAAPAPPRVRPPSAPVTTELPLFMQVMSEPAVEQSVGEVRERMPLTVEAVTDVVEPAGAAAVEDVDDRPLVRVPTVLRPPLAVRRTTPDPARLRAKYARAAAKSNASAAGDLLQGIEDPASSVSPRAGSAVRLSAEPTLESLPAGWLQGVSAGKRLSAAALDGALLGALNAAVVWFTLSVCGMGRPEAHLLPLVPMALFFLLVDGGYLVLFTAACGQTIGKMAAGIRVVGTTTGAVINDRISFGQALARSIGAIVSCVPLGAGFWMSLVGDGRAMHDRIAHTRVVRA